MAMKDKQTIYRIQFHNNDHVYELYARSIAQDFSYGFVEVADMIFGERSELLVDPAEEKLKAEFEGVKRTYVPVSSVIRIDEVEKAGSGKIRQGSEVRGNISSFPIGRPGKPGDS